MYHKVSANLQFKAGLRVLVFVFLVSFVCASCFFLLSKQNVNQQIVSAIPSVDSQITYLLTKHSNTFFIRTKESVIPQAQAEGGYAKASSYLALNFNTGDVVEEKNLDQKLPIASLTKIMTAIVALDLANPGDQFLVTNQAAKIPPTTIGVRVGQKLTLEELLNAMLLTSANDAAEVVRDGVNAKYGQAIFVDAMNKKAEFLGLKDSHFTNPQGFDNSENYSSVHDLAVLTHYAFQNYPLFASIVRKSSEVLLPTATHPRFDLNNWNGLIGVYPETVGVKIGNTTAAGMTMVVLSKRNNDPILAVMLGAPDILHRDLYTASLLDDAYQKEYGLDPVQITEQQLRDKYGTWQYWN